MLNFSLDPERDFDRLDAMEARRLDRLPKCHCCGEPIQTQTAVCVGEKWFCDECERDAFEYIIDDYRITVGG